MSKKLNELTGQSELFDLTELSPITEEDYAEEEARVDKMGQQAGDEFFNLIQDLVIGIIKKKAAAVGLDLEDEAAKHNMDVLDYVLELDEFYELTSNLCASFLKGMEYTWPNPIIS